MRSLDERLKRLESHVTTEPGEMFIDDYNQPVIGYTVCPMHTGGTLVEILEGESMEVLQARCREVDRGIRRQSPFDEDPGTVCFAEHDARKEVEI